MDKIPFRWSWSRHRTLEGCPRRYWYQYYGSRNGWRAKEGHPAREIYRLKRLQGGRQWVGLRVHELAEDILKATMGGGLFPAATVRDRWELESRAELEAGVARGDLDNPKDVRGFEAVEYGLADEGFQDALWEDLLGQADALQAHPLFVRVLERPELVKEVETFGRVWMGDVPVTVSLDCLIHDPDKGWFVIDWKTGTRHAEDVVDAQLVLYTSYVRRRYRARLGDITAVSAMTRDGSHRQTQVEWADIGRMKKLVAASAERMVGMLDGSGKDRVDKDDAPMLPEGSETCGECRFRVLCGR